MIRTLLAFLAGIGFAGSGNPVFLILALLCLVC